MILIKKNLQNVFKLYNIKRYLCKIIMKQKRKGAQVCFCISESQQLTVQNNQRAKVVPCTPTLRGEVVRVNARAPHSAQQ